MNEFFILVASILSALLTYEIGTVRRKGPVRASAAVALAFGLPFYFAPAAGIALGALAPIPAATMGASFVGMSSEKAAPSRTWIAISAAIFSAIFLFSSPVFAGNGGGLGISAFISVVTAIGIRKIATEIGKLLE